MTADGQGGGRIGRVLLRLPSPSFSLRPPELYNRELIPPAQFRAMEHSWFKRDFVGRDVVFSLVEDAIVAGDGLVFTDDLKLVPASFAFHKPEEIERAREAVAQARRNGGPPERSGTYVLCKKNGTRNYGHWLMEMFPKAALVQQHFADRGMWFVVPAPGGRLDAVITDSMQSLGVGPERLLRAGDRPVRIERLLLVEGLTQHGGYMSPLVIEVVRRLAEGIAPGPHRRLYVPREAGAKRNFTDPEAVQARAEATGHWAFDPGSADLATQIATFAGARRIVGLMGAAMTNVVFAPDGAEVVVLAPGAMPDTFFWFIAALRGFRYVEVRCPTEGEFDAPEPWRHQMLRFPEADAGIVFPPIAPGAEPALPAPSLGTAAGAGQVYRQVRLADLVKAGVAQVTPYLPASVIEVPPLSFGETDARRLGLDERVPPGAAGSPIQCKPIGAYVLRDVAVHTHCGVVTHGDRVLWETTAHLPIDHMPGVEKVGEAGLRLPDWPVAATLPSAYHLLYPNLDNYFHWVLDVLARFNAAEFHGYGVLDEVGNDIRLLAPRCDRPWQQQSYDLFVPPGLPTHVMADATTVRVERLIYIPPLIGFGLIPHRALLAVVDRARAAAHAALQVTPAAPWRRLFVSRADSKARVLVNEAELAALAATAGFETVVLGSMSVAEQVRLFAEASHVIAPHGAGLTNLLFCRPGAAVCELHMDLYLHWAFRRLAALRGLRYGCLVGAHDQPRQPLLRDTTWRLDPAALAAVLADPRFVAG